MGKKSKTYNDEEILKGIQTNDRRMLEYVYRQFFPMIKEYVVSNSGNDYVAWDIFQEGILVVYSKMQKGKMVLRSAFSTFFLGICKNLWLNHLNDRENKEVIAMSLKQLDNISIDEEELKVLADENLLFILIQKYMDELSPECRKLLRMISEGYSGQEIATELGYASQSFVYNKKSRCISMILQKIKNDPIYKINMGNEYE